jgi:hypothetical protein
MRYKKLKKINEGTLKGSVGGSVVDLTLFPA